MVKKTEVELAKEQLSRAAARFIRAAISSGVITLGGYLLANNFDWADWKQYTIAALVALGTGCLQGISKWLRDEGITDLKLI